MQDNTIKIRFVFFLEKHDVKVVHVYIIYSLVWKLNEYYFEMPDPINNTIR